MPTPENVLSRSPIRCDCTKHFPWGKNTPWRFPPHNFQRLYFHVSAPMITHGRMSAPLLLHVFRCAQAFKHNSVQHVFVMGLCVCVCFSPFVCKPHANTTGRKSDASLPQSSYMSFIPSVKKDKLRTWEGNGLSLWLSDIWREGITVASGGYETFLHSYRQSGMYDWHNGAEIC